MRPPRAAQGSGREMARTPKLDTQLAEATDDARAALGTLLDPERIGEHLGATADADRLVTHRFAAEEPGYAGWEWYVTLSRASRSKQVTVSESGLLPGAGALLAPAWVPWAERMAPEEVAAAKAVADEEQGAGSSHGRSDAGSEDGTGGDDETVEVEGSPQEDEAAGEAGAGSEQEGEDRAENGSRRRRARRRRR